MLVRRMKYDGMSGGLRFWAAGSRVGVDGKETGTPNESHGGLAPELA